jgi:hypothetical protein
MKDKILKEVKSMITTILAVMLVDGQDILIRIMNGDWTKPALLTFGLLIVRSLVKVLMIQIWPNLKEEK